MSTILLFKSIGNKHDVYKSKDYMKTFCESVREHALEIINLIKKNMMLVKKKHPESDENANIDYICKEKFENKYVEEKNSRKVRDRCHYTRKY